MKLSRVFLDYLHSLDEARMMLKAPAAFLPFAIFGAVLCLALMSLTFFTVPPLSAVMVPVMRFLGGEQALHYPMHFILLPGLFQRVYLPLFATAGFVLFAVAVFRMVSVYAAHGARVIAAPRFASVVVPAVVVGIVYVAAAALPAIAGAWLLALDTPAPEGPLKFVVVCLSAALQTLLVYSLLHLRISGPSVFSALRGSVGTARRYFWPTLLIFLTVAVAHIPIDYVVGQPDRVVLKFRAEVVFYAMLAGILVDIAGAWLIFAATTGLVVSPRETAR